MERKEIGETRNMISLPHLLISISTRLNSAQGRAGTCGPSGDAWGALQRWGGGAITTQLCHSKKNLQQRRLLVLYLACQCACWNFLCSVRIQNSRACGSQDKPLSAISGQLKQPSKNSFLLQTRRTGAWPRKETPKNPCFSHPLLFLFSALASVALSGMCTCTMLW